MNSRAAAKPRIGLAASKTYLNPLNNHCRLRMSTATSPRLSCHHLALGAIHRSDGVLFRVWSPGARRIEVLIDRTGERMPLAEIKDEYFECFVPGLRAADTYWYILDDDRRLPDPASRYQPSGVHGPSQVVDPSGYLWGDDHWQGVAQRELAFYELHVGTFTREGTFRGVQEKLPYLRDLGITAIQLMPSAEFAGRWNWGYDSVALYAPFHRYGTPDDLRALVDAAHCEGLAVFLDVVYNHFGPDGCSAVAFGKFFSEHHCSPWGQGINLDDNHCQGVRGFFIDNAVHWLREYHMDGLRLDATHALQDDSEVHFLSELSATVESLPGRKRFLVAEDERNLSRLVRPRSESGYGLDAVWADDFHHQIRNLTAGDVEGYFADFAATTAKDIAATLQQGWFYTGQHSVHSGGPRGTNSRGLAPERFVICIQNHDQVGNRALGDRLHAQISPAMYRAASSLLLFAPQLPLLFMGQEWAADTPFQFFTDHHEELGKLISQGRRKEFARFIGFAQDEVPDPQDPATFERCKLDWNEPQAADHEGILNLYRDLLWLRRRVTGEVVIELYGEHALGVTRGRHRLLLALAADQCLPLPQDWQLVLDSEEPQYAANGQRARRQDNRVWFARPGAVVCTSEPEPTSTGRH